MTAYRIITSTGTTHDIEHRYPDAALKLAIEAMTGRARASWHTWSGWNAYSFKPEAGVQILDPAKLITADAFDESGAFAGGITVRLEPYDN
jgi:hypothetical protein